jgi:hypothetical protein
VDQTDGDGGAQVWDVGAADSTEDAECCASIETNARLTCMDAVSLMTAIETDTGACQQRCGASGQ